MSGTRVRTRNTSGHPGSAGQSGSSGPTGLSTLAGFAIPGRLRNGWVMHRACLPLVGVALVVASGAAAADVAPITTAKPWTRWWWPGSAVDERNLTRELEAFAAAGLGGVEITPIYGAKGYEDRYVEYLSPRWMELLEYTTREAKRLGLGVDMATGTGWPFGGPWVTPADASEKIQLRDGRPGGGPTNMEVKRAAPGGEGLVLDPYSPQAMSDYLARFTRAFSDFPAGRVRAQFHDSFEYYDASWTPALPAKFRELHGYDIQDFTAALLGQASVGDDTLRRLKSDYRETLAQLHLDYLRTWAAWSHAHGFIVRNQSHGAPANLLDLYGAVDIPETETFGSTPFPIPGLRRDPADVRTGQDLPDSLMIRMASSAAHVMGRPLASSETCTWLREHWKVALAFTKPEIDRLFTDGINHIFYHGTCYSPDDAPWPGWLFYAATQFNDRNTWWQDFPALNAYVARVQTVLQAGRPDNDVLLYFPFHDVIDDPAGLMQQYGVHNIGWLRDSPCGKLATLLTTEGYGWDYISDAQLQQSHVADGAMVTPGGNRYRALVVPTTRRMPVATLRRLREMQQQKAAVIFEALPEDVPGLGRLEERRAQFRETREAMAQSGETDGEVTAALQRSGAWREAVVATGLRFIRRADAADGHTYFLANLTDHAVDQWVTLGPPASRATLIDPLNGEVGQAALQPGDRGQARVYLQLAPGESMLLAITGRHEAVAPGSAWAYAKPAGRAVAIEGDWNITFLRGGPELPGPVKTSVLKSWTDPGGEAARRFAGTARYRLAFTLPDDASADDWLLDLGDMRESARVRVNGAEVGTLWSLPFRARVGRYLHPGTNVLELDVTNLAANRIRDLDRRGVNWKIMREINFVNINYRPFDASDWDLTPSGLLGPVRLVPLQTFTPAATP